MEREIKCRALAKDGTWRYGYYPCLNVDMGNTKYPMDIFWNNFLSSFRRETLGQWTGLLDKQGKEIYEGDILNWTVCGVVTYEVEGFLAITPLGSRYHISRERNVEVIGNIYENPELVSPTNGEGK